jgi:hypothetical protein
MGSTAAAPSSAESFDIADLLPTPFKQLIEPMAIASNANPTALLDLVIFGGVGDLSVRKLLPALYMAHLHDNLGAGTRIHALGRQSWDRGAFVAFIQEKVPAFIGRKAFNESAWDGFVQRLNYVSADVTQAIDFQALGSALQPGSDRVCALTLPGLNARLGRHGAVPEPVGLVSRLHDVTVVGQPVQ